MLIGIDASRALRARRTGTENYSFQLIRHLLALGSQHRFRLYCPEPPPPDLLRPVQGPIEPDQVEIRVIPMPRVWTHSRLSVETTRHPPDVLFVPSHVLPIVHPSPSVVTVHDLGYRYFPEAHSWRQRAYLEAGTRFSAQSASHALADSQATKHDLARFYDIPLDRVTVVHLGRDESLAPVENAGRLLQLQERLGIARSGEPAPYVLYVGTLQPRKNLVRLVDAFAQVHRTMPDVRLVLAGQPGWSSEPIFRRIEELGLQQTVVRPGFVAAEDLSCLLSGAQVFAFPSLYEGFGLPVLEAQACGVPVLASNSSSLPEIAGTGAILVDPLDVREMAAGLYRLLTDRALRDALRAAGFANIRRFSWHRCAAETLQVLEALA